MWDQMFRATLNYGRKGLPLQAISAVDLALWDLLGKLRNEPVSPAGEPGQREPGDQQKGGFQGETAE